MISKVTHTNLGPDMEKAYEQLSNLHKTIRDEMSLVNMEDVQDKLRDLEKTIKMIGNKVHKSATITPIDEAKTKSLFKLMQEIQHTPGFSQALGPHQAALLGLFQRIEHNLQQAKSKVEPVGDINPMNP